MTTIRETFTAVTACLALGACGPIEADHDGCGHEHPAIGSAHAALGEAGTIGRVGGSVPRPFLAAALPDAGEAVRCTNLIDGETVYYDMQLVSGDAPARAETVRVSRNGVVVSELPVGNGRFVGLVELEVGVNTLEFVAEGAGGEVSAHTVEVTRAASTSPRTVEFVYGYLQGTDGSVLTVDGEVLAAEEVARRIGLMARVIQGLMAEYGHESGLRRQTFTLARDEQGDPRVTLFELPFDQAQVDAWKQTDDRTDMEIYTPTKAAIIDHFGCTPDESLGFAMSCGGRIIIVLSNLDTWSALANTYSTGINAEARLHTWPGDVEELFARFADDSAVPQGMVGAGLPVYEALGRAVGTTMHELGHTLGLKHGGVADSLEMMRASGHGLYRLFTTADVEADGAPSHLEPRPGLGPVSALWLQDSPFTDTDDSRAPAGPCPTMTLDAGTGAFSIEAAGAPLRSVALHQDITQWYMTFPGEQPRRFDGSVGAVGVDMAPYRLNDGKVTLLAFTADGQRCAVSAQVDARSQAAIVVSDLVDDAREWYAWDGAADGRSIALEGDTIEGAVQAVALDGSTGLVVWKTRAEGSDAVLGRLALVGRDGTRLEVLDTRVLPERVTGAVQAVALGEGRAAVLYDTASGVRGEIVQVADGQLTPFDSTALDILGAGPWAAARVEGDRLIVAGAQGVFGLQVIDGWRIVVSTSVDGGGTPGVPSVIAINDRNALLGRHSDGEAAVSVVNWPLGGALTVGSAAALPHPSTGALELARLNGVRFAARVVDAEQAHVVAVHRDGMNLTIGETAPAGEVAALVGVAGKTALAFGGAGTDPAFPGFGLMGRVVRVKEPGSPTPLVLKAPRPMYSAAGSVDAAKLDGAHVLLVGAHAEHLELRIVRR